MKSSIWTIARKELARFFSNKVSALVSIIMPGFMIFMVWSLMGTVMTDMASVDEDVSQSFAVVNLPESVEAAAQSVGMEFVEFDALPDTAEIREDIEAGDYRAFAVFPGDFDSTVSAYNPADGGAAPQVEIYFDSTEVNSRTAYSGMVALLDGYESSLANRFDVNAGSTTYDVADGQSIAANLIVSIIPMILLIMLFSGCMAVAAEAIAGEKERGTMATLLATPVRRRDIALGKILALTIISLTIASSSAIGVFASLPNLTSGAVDFNIYGPSDYALLALVILSTTLIIVMIITIVSTLAKTIKEATLYLTPLMVVVMAIGLLGMLGGGVQNEIPFYFIPLYNSVQCMIAIFSFDFQPVTGIICVVSNLVYTGVGVVALQKMFNSERLMFAR